MLKLIIGVKGTGKTKVLIDMVDSALAVTKGDVVCIEKGAQLRFDIKPAVRLVNSEEYLINDAAVEQGRNEIGTDALQTVCACLTAREQGRTCGLNGDNLDIGIL